MAAVNNSKRIRSLLSFFIIVVALVGTYQTIYVAGELSDNDILYFTIQSNLWIAIMHVYFLIYGKVTPLSWTIYFITTVSISLTMLTFFILLVPEIGWFVVFLPGSIETHVLVPIAAITYFLAFERGIKIPKSAIFLSILPPLIYFIVLFLFSSNGMTFINDMPFPYFFLNYHILGWLQISAGRIGVMYWILILCLFVMLIAFVLLKIKSNTASRNLT